MFISSCSQEDSNPMFETNSETHINNLESKALPSVLVTIWIRKQVYLDNMLQSLVMEQNLEIGLRQIVFHY